MSQEFTFDIPFKSRVVPQILDEDAVIRFHCHKGISCFNACCKKAEVMLTPYDIIRLKQHLGMNGSDFLKTYTLPFEMDADKMAGVKIRPDDQGACPFVTPEGCSVYADRPTACRYYPIGHLAMHAKDAPHETTHHVLVKEPYCRGHDEDRTISIAAYRQEQDLEIYDAMNQDWLQLILKKKSAGPTVGKPPELSLHLFFMACFDQDRFRRFVLSESFRNSYDLDDSLFRELETDDIALMKFGFRFLRQVLFAERSLPERAGAWEERYERRKEVFELRRQVEIARAQQLEDDKYAEGL